MKKKAVLKYFGGVSQAARALGYTRQGIQQWPDTVPPKAALLVELLSDGMLKADRPVPRKKKSPRQSVA